MWLNFCNNCQSWHKKYSSYLCYILYSWADYLDSSQWLDFFLFTEDLFSSRSLFYLTSRWRPVHIFLQNLVTEYLIHVLHNLNNSVCLFVGQLYVQLRCLQSLLGVSIFIIWFKSSVWIHALSTWFEMCV